MLGNRAIYHEGWKAVSYHRPDTNFEDDVWELYNLEEDFSEFNDLAQQHPEKLQQLIDIWWEEAKKYNVLPLDGRGLFGRMTDIGATEEIVQHYFPPVGGFHQAQTFGFAEKHSVTIELNRKSFEEQGTLIADGGRFGGWVLYVKNNKLIFTNNYIGEVFSTFESSDLPLGDVKIELKYSPNTRISGDLEIFINDELIGQLQDFKRSFGIGVLSIGKSALTPVVEDVAVPYAYDGHLRVVTIKFPAFNKDREEILHALQTD